MNMGFLDDNYLLSNKTASKILNEIKNLPIVDAHNHGNAHEILENKNYEDIWQVEAATDHYIWELMRKRGIDEYFITGKALNNEKWMKLASVFPDFVGNPAYEWIHLDLKDRLGINELISNETAQIIWDKAKTVLATPQKCPQQLLKEMHIESMCTTNDPTELLEDHQKLAELLGKGYIRPTWRPDKAINIFKNDWGEYIQKLGKRVNRKIKTLDQLVSALKETHDYFATLGCIASDHGLEVPLGYVVEKEDAEAAFNKRLAGEDIDEGEEQMAFMSYMLHEFGRMNAEKGWVMQLHIGAVRDVRDSLFDSLGTDTGGDISDHTVDIVDPLIDFLNSFDEYDSKLISKQNKLKVVIYCLEPSHQTTLATLTRAFGKNVNLGSAWWFNDTPIGMRRQLEYIVSVDLLMNFAGMVTDSRKILSYGSRTVMFRRVLSDVLGSMVEKGQIPETLAIRAAKHVCYDGPKKLFGF
jgi:glucuronate isomerase